MRSHPRRIPGSRRSDKPLIPPFALNSGGVKDGGKETWMVEERSLNQWRNALSSRLLHAHPLVSHPYFISIIAYRAIFCFGIKKDWSGKGSLWYATHTAVAATQKQARNERRLGGNKQVSVGGVGDYETSPRFEKCL
jgi:hypothetical protein